ncbi:MAG: phage shock protein operon transcriptional activator [Cellvibrionaceae bacterium]
MVNIATLVLLRYRKDNEEDHGENTEQEIEEESTVIKERTDRMIGESSSFLEVQEKVSLLAPLNKPVLIIGERGTGKELVAARVHYLSERWGQPFLKVNCAAISESLLDSELFGHEAGSFSGATKQHKGVFERADGGTLFLDELATTSQQVQEKILRVIEYGEFSRLGGDKTLSVDVRLVAATNGDLPSMAKNNKFRSDLLDRLAFDVITLPPLRARQEDILLLAEFFAMGMIKELDREYFPGFSRKAQHELLSFDWPGNIRELKNVVERAIYRSEDPDDLIDEIVFDPFKSPYRPVDQSLKKPVGENNSQPDSLSNVHDCHDVTSDDVTSHYVNTLHSKKRGEEQKSIGVDQPSSKSFKEKIQSVEVALIQAAYKECQFNQRKTAEVLGLTYDQLRGYLKKYHLTSRR